MLQKPSLLSEDDLTDRLPHIVRDEDISDRRNNQEEGSLAAQSAAINTASPNIQKYPAQIPDSCNTSLRGAMLL